MKLHGSFFSFISGVKVCVPGKKNNTNLCLDFFAVMLNVFCFYYTFIDINIYSISFVCLFLDRL